MTRNPINFINFAITLILFSIVQIVLSSDASAEGFFDKLDPCISQTKSFEDGRKKIRAAIQHDLSTVNSSKPAQEYKDIWWEEKRIMLRLLFDKSSLASIVKDSGGNLDVAFPLWFAEQIIAAGGPDKINEVLNADFRKMRELELLKQSDATEADLEKAKNELYGECKPDVLNQSLRVAMTGAMAPVNIMSGNWEGAKRESGDLAKIVRATLGISWKDIKANGICGGSNSEFRKLFGQFC